MLENFAFLRASDGRAPQWLEARIAGPASCARMGIVANAAVMLCRRKLCNAGIVCCDRCAGPCRPGTNSLAPGRGRTRHAHAAPDPGRGGSSQFCSLLHLLAKGLKRSFCTSLSCSAFPFVFSNSANLIRALNWCTGNALCASMGLVFHDNISNIECIISEPYTLLRACLC